MKQLYGDSRLGRKVSSQEALAHIEKCSEAGLVHFIGRNTLDLRLNNISLKQSHKLLTICHCCECCCLSRLLPYVSPTFRDVVEKMPGVTLTVTERCVGCGKCVDVCFVQAIQIINKYAVISELCRGCGRCEKVCPKGAIKLTIDPESSETTINMINTLKAPTRSNVKK
ncbi:MAG: DUF362 domain-containing protein [Candidatus Hodarchaeota archaeon]